MIKRIGIGLNKYNLLKKDHFETILYAMQKGITIFDIAPRDSGTISLKSVLQEAEQIRKREELTFISSSGFFHMGNENKNISHSVYPDVVKETLDAFLKSSDISLEMRVQEHLKNLTQNDEISKLRQQEKAESMVKDEVGELCYQLEREVERGRIRGYGIQQFGSSDLFPSSSFLSQLPNLSFLHTPSPALEQGTVSRKGVKVIGCGLLTTRGGVRLVEKGEGEVAEKFIQTSTNTFARFSPQDSQPEEVREACTHIRDTLTEFVDDVMSLDLESGVGEFDGKATEAVLRLNEKIEEIDDQSSSLLMDFFKECREVVLAKGGLNVRKMVEERMDVRKEEKAHQALIRWALEEGGVDIALLGPSNKKQIDEIVDCVR